MSKQPPEKNYLLATLTDRILLFVKEKRKTTPKALRKE
jgi:hypothetical protein